MNVANKTMKSTGVAGVAEGVAGVEGEEEVGRGESSGINNNKENEGHFSNINKRMDQTQRQRLPSGNQKASTNDRTGKAPQVFTIACNNSSSSSNCSNYTTSRNSNSNRDMKKSNSIACATTIDRLDIQALSSGSLQVPCIGGTPPQQDHTMTKEENDTIYSWDSKMPCKQRFFKSGYRYSKKSLGLKNYSKSDACYYFNNPNGCRFGDSCRYIHSPLQSATRVGETNGTGYFEYANPSSAEAEVLSDKTTAVQALTTSSAAAELISRSVATSSAAFSINGSKLQKQGASNAHRLNKSFSIESIIKDVSNVRLGEKLESMPNLVSHKREPKLGLKQQHDSNSKLDLNFERVLTVSDVSDPETIAKVSSQNFPLRVGNSFSISSVRRHSRANQSSPQEQFTGRDGTNSRDHSYIRSFKARYNNNNNRFYSDPKGGSQNANLITCSAVSSNDLLENASTLPQNLAIPTNPIFSMVLAYVATGRDHNARSLAQISLVDEFERLVFNTIISQVSQSHSKSPSSPSSASGGCASSDAGSGICGGGPDVHTQVISYLTQLTSLTKEIVDEYGIPLEQAMILFRQTIPSSSIIIGFNVLKDIAQLNLIPHVDFFYAIDLRATFGVYDAQINRMAVFSIDHCASIWLEYGQGGYRGQRDPVIDCTLSMTLFNKYRSLQYDYDMILYHHSAMLNSPRIPGFSSLFPVLDGVCTGCWSKCKCGGSFSSGKYNDI